MSKKGRMKLAIKIVEAAILSWCLAMRSSEATGEEVPTQVHPETPFIFEGIVVSVPPSKNGVSALQASLPSLPRNFSAEPLGTNSTFLMNDKRLVRMSSQSAVNLKPLTRKNNLCKRAKVRRALSLEKIGHRARCEPNLAYFTSLTPNDPNYSLLFASQWMSLESAWDVTTGSPNVIALVIDTGIDYNHPDIAANMWRNPNEIPSNGIDDDRNGYIDDIHGINAITNRGDPLDDHGHGTHVAGTIGAVGNNAVGVAGVAWNVRLAGAKFLSSGGSGSLSDAVKAINYGITLRKAGHRVLLSNNSWGGGGFSSTLAAAIEAAGKAGTLFVAAAGNSNSNNDVTAAYPASYSSDSIIAVASSTSTGARSSFSNYGATSVDIAAPGSNIFSTLTNNRYNYMSGTSMASPQVAGVAALVQSVCNGNLTVAQTRNAILSTGTVYPAWSGLVATSAIVNAAKAVSAALASCPPTATPSPAPTSTPRPSPSATPAVTPTSAVTVSPSPTPLRTPTPTHTFTPVRTPTSTPTLVATASPTRVATRTETPRPTATSTPIRTSTPAPTPTSRITPTQTPAPLPTRIPQTATPTATPREGQPRFIGSSNSARPGENATLRAIDIRTSKPGLSLIAENASFRGNCSLGAIELTRGASGTLSFSWPGSVNFFSRLRFELPAASATTIEYTVTTTAAVPRPSREQTAAALLDVCTVLRAAVTGANQRRR